MLGIAFAFGCADGALVAAGGDAPESSPQVEILAEPGIVLDAGDGTMLTEG